jgi:hypothetical protein
MLRRFTIGLIFSLIFMAGVAWGQSRGEVDFNIKSISFWGGIKDITSNGNYLYCTFIDGLSIYDLSDPLSPASKKELDFGSSIKPVFYGSYMLVGLMSDSMVIYDNSDPENPIFLNKVPMAINVHGAWVYDSYLFVIQENIANKIVIYSLADPTNPQYISEYTTAEDVYNVYLRGDRLYLPVCNHGVEIVDFSNPETPVHLSYAARSNYPAYSVAFKDNYIVYSTQFSNLMHGIAVFDVTDEEYPVFADSFYIYGVNESGTLQQRGDTLFILIICTTLML